MISNPTYFRYRFALIFSAVSLIAIGGCGGSRDSQPSVAVPVVSPFILTKTVYSTGDSIALSELPSAATAATLTFNDGQKFSIPIMPDGSVMVPVLIPSLVTQTVKLSVSTAKGEFRSQDIRLEPITINTSKPGVATLIYLDSSIANLNSAIDELVTLSGDPLTADTTELGEIRETLVKFRDAIIQAQSGTPFELSAPSDTSKFYIDNMQLGVFDQYVMAMLNTTARGTTANVSTLQQRLALGTKVSHDTPPDSSIRLHSLLISDGPLTNASINCGGLTDQADRAWCANMATQITNDYIINYAGMVGVAGGTASAALGALSAIGIAGVAFPAAILGSVALGTVVVANMVGAGVQAASVYGTGSAKGTDVRNNMSNLVNTARGYVTGNIAKLLPNGGSELIKKVNSTVTKIVAPAVFDAYDKLVEKYTKVVSACSAQATSGGQGNFANRYDFGSARALTLSYDAFSVPDQFSVFDESGSLTSTGGLVSGSGALKFTTTAQFVTVKVAAPSAGTAWNYSINCAN